MLLPMRQSVIRVLIALLLGPSLTLGGGILRLPAPNPLAPKVSLAASETVTTCTGSAFGDALASVQSEGGGIITLDCSGTITVANQYQITSDVTIVGNNTVTMSGGNSSRLFRVHPNAALHLVGLTLKEGNGTGAYFSNWGGAVMNSGSLTVTNSTFSDNHGVKGSALYNDGGILTIIDSTFTNNIGTGEGGTIYNSGPMVIAGSSFTNNAGQYGGVIMNNSNDVATITDSIFSDNQAGEDGGAIMNYTSSLQIRSSTFSSNEADQLGGAIMNRTGSVDIGDSTFDSNLALAGGAIYNYTGNPNIPGLLTVTTSTLTGNQASNSAGAIFNHEGIATITASTITGNHAANAAGGIYNGDSMTIASTIVAGNTASSRDPNCSFYDSAQTSEGYNLSDDDSCSFFTATGDIQNSSALNLGTLQDNGGPTQTILPATGSDAIDAAACGSTTPMDQRGVSRPNGQNCDIGAVETTGTVPVRAQTIYGIPTSETMPTTVKARATGPAGVTFDFAFDCDDDGNYETAGAASGSTGSAACTYSDDGAWIFGVQVCDAADSNNCDIVTGTVNVFNDAPTISEVANDGPVDEGSSATITVTATDPAGANDPLSYAFDCDDDGDYEVGPQQEATTACVFGDNGDFSVGVQVSDGDDGVAVASTTVTVNNVSPSIDSFSIAPSPSIEGESVVASATFSDPGTTDSHTCTVDYGDGPQPGVVDGLTCTGPAHVYVDDDPSGTASDDYSVTIVVTDKDGGSDETSATHTVENAAPVIDNLTTDGPVPQGRPITVTVDASDVGINDTLSFSFDCGNDGDFEIGPQASNSATCTFVPGVAFPVIAVRVTDDDLGVVEDTIQASQTITLCVNYATGSFSTPTAAGCPAGTITTTLPGAGPMTICINSYTGSFHWQPNGVCAGTYQTHLIPGSGPLHYCQNLWTGKLRYTANGECGFYERAGVIPG